MTVFVNRRIMIQKMRSEVRLKTARPLRLPPNTLSDIWAVFTEFDMGGSVCAMRSRQQGFRS